MVNKLRGVWWREEEGLGDFLDFFGIFCGPHFWEFLMLIKLCFLGGNRIKYIYMSSTGGRSWIIGVGL